MKFLFSILILLMTGSAIGQNLTYSFDGAITNFDTGKKEAGVTVSLVQGNKIVASAVTSSNGKYVLKALLPAKSNFTVTFTKVGFVSKTVSFDFQGMEMEELKEGQAYFPVDNFSFEIFSERPGVDFSFLKTEPVGQFKYNAGSRAAVLDRAGYQRMKDKIEGLLKKAEEKSGEDDAKYNAVIKEADGLFAQKKYEEALSKYETAAGLKPKELHPQNRIKEIDAFLKAKAKEELAAQQKDKEYQNLITAANNLRDQKKYTEAIAKYKEAMKIKSENYPSDEIKKIEVLIADEKKKAENDKLYQSLITQADASFAKKDWTNAKTQYSEASRLKTEEAYPKTQLDKIAKFQDADKAEEAKRKEFETLMKSGESLFTQSKFEEAKVKYQEAAALLPAEIAPKDRIKACDVELSKKQANSKQEEAIKTLFEEGQKLIDAKNYPQAKLKYSEIVKLDPSKTQAQRKLEEIDRLVKEEQDAKNAEANFKKLVLEGDGNVKSMKLELAKDKYTEALLLKEDKIVREKLIKVETELAGSQAKSLMKEKYAETMKQADALLAESKLEAAKSKYEAASIMDETQALPKQKIKEIDLLLSKTKESDKAYRDAIAAGDKLMTQENYLGAIKEFNKALALKPQEQEPKDKALEAERLEKAKSGEVDANYERIISTAKTKVEEGDYDKAIELLNRAKGFRPEDKRPIEMMAEINRLKTADKVYKEKVALAEKSAAAKDYNRAIVLFTDAGKAKPQEALPPKRINELKALLGETTEKNEKERQYNEYMSTGQAAMTSKQYQGATESFKAALRVKPGDQAATDKIKEIEQILDDLRKKEQGNEEEKKLIETYLKNADAKFRTRNYDEARKIYKQALAVDYTLRYAQKQVEECTRLLAEAEAFEKEQAYKKIIAEADKEFDKKSWEAAKSTYQKALDMQPDASYPRKKLEEIEQILNPTVVQSGKLEPLGEKFEGDAGAELAKADLLRKNSQNGSVKNTRSTVTNVSDSIGSKRYLDQKAKDQEIFAVQTKTREVNQAAQQDLQGNNNNLDEIKRKAVELTEMNANLDRSENLRGQEKLDDTQNRLDEKATTEALILQGKSEQNKAVLTEIKNKNDDLAQEAYLSQQEKAKSLKENSFTIEQNNGSNDASRRVTEVQIQAAKINLYEQERIRQEKETASNQMAKKEIGNTQRESDYKNLSDSQIALKNNDQVVQTQQKAINTSESVLEDSRLKSKKTVDDLDKLEDRILIENELRDGARKEGVEQLKANQTTLDDQSRNAYNREMDKYLSTKAAVAEQEKNNNYRFEQSVEESKKNSLVVDDVRMKANNAREELDRLDAMENKATATKIEQVAISVRDNAATTTVQQEKNQEKLTTLKAVTIQNSDILSSQTEEKVRAQKQKVENVLTVQAEKVEADAASAKLNQLNLNELKSEKNQEDDSRALEARNQQLAAQTSTDNLISRQEKETTTTNKQQFENSRVVGSLASQNATAETMRREQSQKDKQYQQSEINKVDSAPVVLKPKNTLGEEYPEGVTEEKFSQNDDKGILKAIITRRIVVVDGHGDVYVRTQTSNITTYNKNGESITEYVWQRETQNSKLNRN